MTNTTLTALTLLHGDAFNFTKPFGGSTGNDPDFFKLTAYGVDASGALLPASLDFFLADYRSSNNAMDYVLKTWSTFDLSALAGARRISSTFRRRITGRSA